MRPGNEDGRPCGRPSEDSSLEGYLEGATCICMKRPLSLTSFTRMLVPVFGTFTPDQPTWKRPWLAAVWPSPADHQVLMSSKTGTAGFDAMVVGTELRFSVIASVCSRPNVES